MLLVTPLMMMLAHYFMSYLAASIILTVLSVAYFAGIIMILSAATKMERMSEGHVNHTKLKKYLSGLKVQLIPTIVAVTVPIYAATVFGTVWFLAPIFVYASFCVIARDIARKNSD